MLSFPLPAYLGVCVVPHGGEGHEPPPEGLYECPGGVDWDVEGGVSPQDWTSLCKLCLTDVDNRGETQNSNTFSKIYE